ncbi:hypothetical protein FH972_008215 [Carpinus fangiana]|uniref:Aminotransferase class I/classII domain-containing protein n=1 Tax=Carpinus fangiana TaxID=176857 RepID=A0A5N6QXZ3_9ROSI|nr:hypothetical protein FH972_008215 [Carpinus fangiana]
MFDLLEREVNWVVRSNGSDLIVVVGMNAWQPFDVFEGLISKPWDRFSVEVQMAKQTFQRWSRDLPITGDEAFCGDEVTDNEEKACPQQSKRLLLFSGNDYLGLSSHPTIGNAAAKAAQEHGMGPRDSALICGYTNYHRLLESSLADLKKKEVDIVDFNGSFLARVCDLAGSNPIILVVTKCSECPSDNFKVFGRNSRSCIRNSKGKKGFFLLHEYPSKSY